MVNICACFHSALLLTVTSNFVILYIFIYLFNYLFLYLVVFIFFLYILYFFIIIILVFFFRLKAWDEHTLTLKKLILFCLLLFSYYYEQAHLWGPTKEKLTCTCISLYYSSKQICNTHNAGPINLPLKNTYPPSPKWTPITRNGFFSYKNL